MRRADTVLVAERLRRVEQGTCHRHAASFVNIGPHEELRSGRGRERHSNNELLVVRESMLSVRPRPLPVEYVLTIAVRLEVQAERTEGASFVLADEVARQPPARSADTARALERTQELEVEEWEVLRLERSPRRLVCMLDAEEPLDPHCVILILMLNVTLESDYPLHRSIMTAFRYRLAEVHPRFSPLRKGPSSKRIRLLGQETTTFKSCAGSF